MLPLTAPDTAIALKELVETIPDRLAAITDEAASKPRAAGKWSRKQVLGHLIDSAANNHQRFVRAAIDGKVTLPGYDQDSWVAVQGYSDEAWSRMIPLWKSYNLHLVHLIERFPADRMKAPCKIGDDAPVPIEFVIRDYVRHLEHHLEQIFGA